VVQGGQISWRDGGKIQLPSANVKLTDSIIRWLRVALVRCRRRLCPLPNNTKSLQPGDRRKAPTCLQIVRLTWPTGTSRRVSRINYTAEMTRLNCMSHALTTATTSRVLLINFYARRELRRPSHLLHQFALRKQSKLVQWMRRVEFSLARSACWRNRAINNASRGICVPAGPKSGYPVFLSNFAQYWPIQIKSNQFQNRLH